MYVVTDILVCVADMLRTSERTFRAGRNVVAPNGDIKADTDTRNVIQTFIPELKAEYGGPETCLCSISSTLLFSTSISCDSTSPFSSSFSFRTFSFLISATFCVLVTSLEMSITGFALQRHLSYVAPSRTAMSDRDGKQGMVGSGHSASLCEGLPSGRANIGKWG